MKSVLDIENQTRAFLEGFLDQELVKRVLLVIKEGLPSYVRYHSYDHTLDVLHEVVFFALYDGLLVGEVELLAWAALYHDSGFVLDPENHEEASVVILRRDFDGAGVFEQTDIELIASLILDTKAHSGDFTRGPQPTSSLSGYLIDADVSNFGRADFFEKLELVIREQGLVRSQFLPLLKERLEKHVWHTHAGRALREERRQVNLRILARDLHDSAI